MLLTCACCSPRYVSLTRPTHLRSRSSLTMCALLTCASHSPRYVPCPTRPAHLARSRSSLATLLTCASYSPRYVSLARPVHLYFSPVHPAHLAISPPRASASLVRSRLSLAPCLRLSSVHLAHLAMSPPTRALLTSLGPGRVESRHTYASHLCMLLTSLCFPRASCPPP